MKTGAEARRLEEDARRAANWKRWGPYLSERQWGTVREDYSATGEAWEYFSHDHARSRAYRWGEDGLLGITDRECRLCFALALWNERDPIIKERLFGLTNREGNHGEAVKECYYYLDSTPTHSYLKALYKYPQAAFPYEQLVAENVRRGQSDAEYSLTDTGVFEGDRYFDVFAEYAKTGPDDIRIRITIANRGPDVAPLHVLPTLWFRNTWSWGCRYDDCWVKPRLELRADGTVLARHATLPPLVWSAEPGPDGAPHFLFAENETNETRVFGAVQGGAYPKDAFQQWLVEGNANAVNPANTGTKAAAHYRLVVPAGGEVTLHLRLRPEADTSTETSDAVFGARIAEAGEYYAQVLPPGLGDDARRVARQAYAGLCWSKQFYHYVVRQWLEGDPLQPEPPPERALGRNADWGHIFNRDVILMPDKWEYPWYAAWDLAFHVVAMAPLDPDFAKEQIILLLREWYMHPNGQLPAYEWNFGDVNPPVHAWAAWRVYKMSAPRGQRDQVFLQRVFHKLLLNFTWWVNRKDVSGRNLFAGGFLGLDNIGVFDRSQPLPAGENLEQADGTAWMAFYCSTMLAIAFELAAEDPAYEDVASKFFEHFVSIVHAMNGLGGSGLWHEEDGFYYDQLLVNGTAMPLRARSMVGLIPLFAVEALEQEVLDRLPGFTKRLQWFMANNHELAGSITHATGEGSTKQWLLAVPPRDRLERILRRMLDPEEFLSPWGIRSLSRTHGDEPFRLQCDGMSREVHYEPGEGESGLFGGNSNWRGPIWFPVNYLIVEALERYHFFFGDDFKVEYPTGSGTMMNLQQVARALEQRLGSIFLPNAEGHCAWQGGDARYANDPHWRGLTLFHEYFHGETGRGLGASHQTGWTALVTRMLR